MPTLDVSLDYLYFDWLQVISYSSRTDEETWATAVPATALKRENKKIYQLGEEQIELSQHNCIWEMWAASISNCIPKRGDKFTATGVSGLQVWDVMMVDYCDKTTRYRLHCQQEGNDA